MKRARRARSFVAVDIGNTSVSFGRFEGDRLRSTWRLPTQKLFASSALFRVLRARLGTGRRAMDCAVASVVPRATPRLLRALRRWSAAPMEITPRMCGIPIKANAREVGVDRVLNCLSARARGKTPALIADFGTAATFDCLSRKGEYLGGAIAPGPELAAEALFLRTARLPRVRLAAPYAPIGRTTAECIRSGLFFGYLGLVDRISSELSARLGRGTHWIATGGFAQFFVPHLARKWELVPELTLEGIRLAYRARR